MNQSKQADADAPIPAEVGRRALEALREAEKHHNTTSLPRAIERYGSMEACGVAGRRTWNDLVPAAITELQQALEKKVLDRLKTCGILFI